VKSRWVLLAAGAAVVAAGATLMRKEGDRPLLIEDARYLRLTSYREDGSEASRPVWFVQRDGVIEITTPEASKKVAQISHDPRVEIAPADMRGKVDEDAERVTGVARIVHGDASDEIAAAVKAKYGWQGKVAETVYGARARAGNDLYATRVGLKITPTERL
jgi:PPOX class probable F420-dependent enzyme